MSRTERLHSLVEELRAAHPAACTSNELAEKFEVTTRTIERDLSTLQESGVPIHAELGQRGSYRIDESHSLPPLGFTAAEAMAIAVSLATENIGPFVEAGITARRKVLAALSAADAEAARRLAGRIRLLDGSSGGETIPAVLQAAVADRSVVSIRLRSADGTASTRIVEPVGLIVRDRAWYLVGWCRLRDAHRSFRLDHIEEVALTGEAAPERDLDAHVLEIAPQLRQEHLFD